LFVVIVVPFSLTHSARLLSSPLPDSSPPPSFLDVFDPRLSAIVIKIVDVSYGGENGFSQAIELSGT